MEPQVENLGEIAFILAPDDKGMQGVFELPVVRRLTLLTRRLGIEEIHILGRVKALEPVLSDLIPSERLHSAEDPSSVDRIIEGLGLRESQRILVMKADQVIDPGSLARLIETKDPSGVYFMQANGKVGTERLWVTPPSYLALILRHLWSPSSDLSLLDDARAVQGTDGLPYFLDGSDEAVKTAEDRLMKALASQTAGEDGFLARHLSRRVSRLISRRLSRTPVTPNQITLGGAGMGMIGALLFSWGGYWFQVIGSLFFLFCVIVDGVDGEIARLKLQESRFGHRLDIIMDNIVHIAIFLGMALGLYRDSGDLTYLHMLWLLLGGFALCGLAVYQCILRRSAAQLQPSAKTVGFMALLSNRDFAYLLVLLALLGRVQWFLIGAAFGTYLFAVTLWLMSFYEKRAVPQKTFR